MKIQKLTKIGGRTMLEIPADMLERLKLKSGDRVGLTVKDDRLIVTPVTKSRYSLETLLSHCDPNAEISPEDRQWLDSPNIGIELL